MPPIIGLREKRFYLTVGRHPYAANYRTEITAGQHVAQTFKKAPYRLSNKPVSMLPPYPALESASRFLKGRPGSTAARGLPKIRVNANLTCYDPEYYWYPPRR